MTFKGAIAIIIAICLFEIFPWPINLIAAFFVLTKHTQNFVLKPLAKYWGARGISPTNYMERKLKNIREVIWFFAIILNIQFVFVLELFAIGISCKIVNNLKNKMEGLSSEFSFDDYKVYDEYLKKNPPLVKDSFYGYLPEDDIDNEDDVQNYDVDHYSVKEQTNLFEKEYNLEPVPKTEYKVEQKVVRKIETKIEPQIERRIETKIETPIEPQMEKKSSKIIEEVFENKMEDIKFEVPNVDTNLFDKPIEDIKTDFSIKTPIVEEVSKFDFDKPIGDITTSITDSTFNTSKIEVKDDEITCEKCGTVMSKNKIACPKCGALVKYKPKR